MKDEPEYDPYGLEREILSTTAWYDSPAKYIYRQHSQSTFEQSEFMIDQRESMSDQLESKFDNNDDDDDEQY
ncbi:hypothetical protein AAHA92_10640 [Salvia divinorum]|uniref:Uncharacterized protein n=1 Tax=Salvia divinorum TaxID=28513 RepID=A0ABD1HVD0_SALDI